MTSEKTFNLRQRRIRDHLCLQNWAYVRTQRLRRRHIIGRPCLSLFYHNRFTGRGAFATLSATNNRLIYWIDRTPQSSSGAHHCLHILFSSSPPAAMIFHDKSRLFSISLNKFREAEAGKTKKIKTKYQLKSQPGKVRLASDPTDIFQLLMLFISVVRD